MQDLKASSSSKGKAREDAQWQLGWWDLCHSLEGTQRTLVWSSSSVIYTPHPTEPSIIARHFPSSTRFVIPSPGVILSSATPFDPPTLISVSPTDDWLFAFFPGRGADGIGCLWRRGNRLDSWQERSLWAFPSGAGAVTAEWTCSEREWIFTETGRPTRLPPRGPRTPLSSPILLVVTQDHQVEVCYLPPYVPSIQISRASLLQASRNSESHVSSGENSMSGLGGRSICMKAAIGMSYNESSILIATRSHVLPSYKPNPYSYSSMDLDLTLDMSQSGSSSESPSSPEWELWGEEPIIHLCEVTLSFKVNATGIMTRPLAPITDSSRHMTDLFFVSAPPAKPFNKSPEKRDVAREALSPPPYLAVSFVDFGDYTTVPKSEIALFSFKKDNASAISINSSWTCREASRRMFEDKMLDFMLPSASRNGLLIGLLNLNGTLPSSKRKLHEVAIGHMSILKIPDLSLDDSFENVPIVSNIATAGRGVPAHVAYSPNYTLLSSTSSLESMGSHVSIHALSRPHHRDITQGSDISKTLPSAGLSSLIATAIYSRKSPSDAVHSLSLSTAPNDIIINTLYDALLLLQRSSNGLTEVWIDEIVAVAAEIYLIKSRKVDDASKESLVARWKTAHDLLSLVACCSAFEECQDGQAYDLDVIWQLIEMSNWFIGFVENIMKECVLIANSVTPQNTDSSTPNIPPFGSPTFVHILNPYSLGKFQVALSHVKRLRDYIASLSAKAENAQIAKDVLLDVVDSSGLNLDQLARALSEVFHGLQSVDQDSLHRSLIACMPLPSLASHLRRTIDKLLDSNIVNKARLFIKPTDLVDSVSRLSVTERHITARQRDVVSKGLLRHHTSSVRCVRCKGVSQVGLNDSSNQDVPEQWRTWERRWTTRCICGGSWTQASHS